ncbi:hypothetical protein SEA_JUMBO_38 [Gordonia phage Jumbo]|uniref:Uncharacterized protein n=1 Tax=Gordonia phage Jumbo TaxID=1887650 RepID=A0A1B3B0N0_9CAUD|nr:membrane protein [Gordonia phage Jumbo]AOE44549.1 hypothetical protein SEA_JUMBO_38 [Gordonia phage Jumbo]
MPYTKLHLDARNPFEIAIITFSIFFSFIQIVLDQYPGAIYTFTDDFYRYLWAGAYLLSSLASGVGILLKHHSQGLSLECWGMYIMGGSLFVYAICLFSVGKTTALFAAGFFTIIAGACFARAIIVHRGFRKIARGDFLRLGEAESNEK